MEKDSKLNVANMKIDQLGYVYKDIKAQAELLEDLYHLPKFAIMDNEHTVQFRGKESPLKLKFGFSRLFGIQIELIQWVEGDCVFKEFIDQGREGLQHVSVFVEDIQAYIDEFQKQGIELVQHGKIHRQEFAYMDTEKTLGIYLELQETKSQLKKKK